MPRNDPSDMVISPTGRVHLDWTRDSWRLICYGVPRPCRLCGIGSLLLDDDRRTPVHKRCREDELTVQHRRKTSPTSDPTHINLTEETTDAVAA